MKDSPRVLLGFTLYGYMPVQAVLRQFRWLTEALSKRRIQHLKMTENMYITTARNEVVKEALKIGATHVFFLDQDTIVSDDCIERLLAHKKLVVGALYYERGSFTPVAGRFDENLPRKWGPLVQSHDHSSAWIDATGTLLRCEVIGMGATLIDCKVFRRMAEYKDYSQGWFDMNPSYVGEDIEFCRRLQDLDIPIYVDPTITTLHIGTVAVGREHAERWHGVGSLI